MGDLNGIKFGYLINTFTLADVMSYYEGGVEINGERKTVATVVTDGRYIQLVNEKKDQWLD